MRSPCRGGLCGADQALAHIFWMIAVRLRAGNGIGGPPGTQEGTRGATDSGSGSGAVTGDACDVRHDPHPLVPVKLTEFLDDLP